jgi:hypothetical protein
MISYSQTTISQLSAHIVGNGANGEELKLSDAPLEIPDERVHSLLLTYFLSNFSFPEYYRFASKNPVSRAVESIFKDPESLHEHSVTIAEHLSEITQHPNIKSGELYISYFDTILVDDVDVPAIGLFKSENKESFLKLTRNFKLHAEEGINIKKLDKGCLILKPNSKEDFKILIVDNTNKGDTNFWRDSFLHLKPVSDAFHQTQNFMTLTHSFVEDQLGEEFSVSKADKIDLLNRSVEFFQSRDQFNKAEFENSVLADADVIESFRNYGKNFMTSQPLDATDQFEISAHAVKQQARVFKSVLKLDKNFHIYIHGNREWIEKGFDETTGKHYYKLYFNQET